jgi:hypothetical protein
VAQPISRRPNSAEARVQTQAISCETYDRRSGTGTDFPLGTPGFSVTIILQILHLFVYDQRYMRLTKETAIHVIIN